MSFFFQAEDGIRDFHVTGVQTCALPISHAWCGDGILEELVELIRPPSRQHQVRRHGHVFLRTNRGKLDLLVILEFDRSEERRVGKGGSARLLRKFENTEERQDNILKARE